MDKLKSTRFWLTVAAFLASIGASIAGVAVNDHVITYIGIVCTIISTAIYAAVKTWDNVAVTNSSTTTTSTNTTLTASGKTALDVIGVSTKEENAEQ